jgi:hypothetical protein
MARPKDRDQDLVIEDDEIVEESPAQGMDMLPVALLVLTTVFLLGAIIINLYHLGDKFKAGMFG